MQFPALSQAPTLCHITLVLIGPRSLWRFTWPQIMITSFHLSLKFPSLSLSAVPFQVNMRRTYSVSFSKRPTPSICAPAPFRTALTGWPSRSRSWTPPSKKVSQMLEVSLSIVYLFHFVHSSLISPPLPPFMFSVSLQDINMRKAFKSSTTQDQQVVSKSSVPIPVREMYNLSDKPPPLNILSTYRSVLLMHAHSLNITAVFYRINKSQPWIVVSQFCRFSVDIIWVVKFLAKNYLIVFDWAGLPGWGDFLGPSWLKKRQIKLSKFENVKKKKNSVK